MNLLRIVSVLFLLLGGITHLLAAPTATTVAATVVTTTGATLNATVNPGGTSTKFYFQYGTNTSYGTLSAIKGLAAGTVDVNTNTAISGLLAHTLYHFRAVATNSAGTNIGSDLTFTTLAALPVVTTKNAVNVGTTNATVVASVNPNGDTATFYFQYGVTNYDMFSSTNVLAAGNVSVTVSNSIVGLSPGVDYQYQVVASNSGGAKTGSRLNFATIAPPTATNVSAIIASGTSVKLLATVNYGYTNTQMFFQYGPTTSYGGISSTALLANDQFTVLLGRPSIEYTNILIGGLATNSLYHYRLMASNVAGVFVGDDFTFATATTTIVSNNNDIGVGSLRNAIADAAPGASVQFATNLAGATIVLTSGALFLGTNVTIDASVLPGGLILNGGPDSAFTPDNGNSSVFIVNGTAVIASLIITNGYQGDNELGGAGVQNYGTLTMNQCTVCGNSADANLIEGGGGILNYGGTLTMNRCTVWGNISAGNGGGGIYNEGTLILNECTLSGNSYDAPGSTFGGGAICNFGNLTINQCTVSGNTGTLTHGGGIYSSDDMAIQMTNCIVGENHTSTGNGEDMYLDSGYNIKYGGSNLVQSVYYSSGSRLGPAPGTAAPNLAPLGSHGGPTPTMPPLPGSPAIDAASDSITNLFTTDQRGLPRLLGLHVDIGAVEGGYNPAGPGRLNGINLQGNSAQVTFTNFTGMSFTALGSTNVALPLSQWTQLGAPFEVPAGSGQYQFTEPRPANGPSFFYRVRSP